MKIPTRLLDFLAQHGVSYEIVHHPVAYTAQELAAIENIKGRQHAKVVIARAGQEPVMAVLPADCRVDWGKLSAVTGRPTSQATEAEMRALFPDCETGTMPPFGALYGVPVFVDACFMVNERVAFEAGTHSDAIKMSGADFARLAGATVAEFAVKTP
jgi:Ala-tRNA(Pro) deacylase